MTDDLVHLRDRFQYHYRRAKRALLKLETQLVSRPSRELEDKAQELRGFIRGLRAANDVAEIRLGGGSASPGSDRSPP